VERENPERRTLRSLIEAIEGLEGPEAPEAPEAPEDRRDAAGTWPFSGDDQTILPVARYHRLSPLLAAAYQGSLQGSLPGAFGDACRRDRVVTAAHNLILASAAEEVLLALAARGIDGVLLKGLAYEAHLYRQTGCRPTSDVDLLVRDGQRREAFSVLSSLGFEPKAAAPGFDDPDYHEVSWSRAHVMIDLHLSLAPRARCAIDYGAVWSEVRPWRLGRANAFLLSPAHAAVFHALHMAIDHFDVPGLYLVDFARLLPSAGELDRASSVARAWRCHRPFATTAALTGAFVQAAAARWTDGRPPAPISPMAARVIAGFGPTVRVARPEQFRRKLAHFDTAGDALRYVAVQTRRNIQELIERHVRKRSPRTRLNVPSG
jgi:Uncharacterised nucleotidyltransferase